VVHTPVENMDPKKDKIHVNQQDIYQQLLQIYELGSQLFINELSSEMS